MAKIDNVNFIDLDVDWVCVCGEKNDLTSIIKTEESIECSECGRSFQINVKVVISEQGIFNNSS